MEGNSYFYVPGIHGVTASAILSRQLMQLEEELGVKLLHRGKYNVTLTEDGMLLKRRAQELVELSDKTIQELSHLQVEPHKEGSNYQPDGILHWLVTSAHAFR